MTKKQGHSGPSAGNRTSGARQIVFGFIALISVIWFGVAQPATAQNFVFSSIEIEGNQRIEPATILTYAGIARGERVTGGQLNAAYQNILGSGLFETVEVVPRGGTLVIRVREYPTINRISIEGNRRLKDEDLLGLLRSQSRRVYSPTQAERDAEQIVLAYETAGRLAATVDPVIIRRSNNRVDLIFEVNEGRVVEVERIGFVGNRSFSDRRLRRVLESKQAGIFRQIIARDTFIADRIQFDRQVLRDFYQSRGFVDFQVLSVSSEVARQRDAYFVTFNIREGQQFRYGAITTISDLPEIDPDLFAAEVRISEGQVYNPAAVDTTIARLERLAIQQGLNFIRVEPRITRNDRALTLDVEFDIVRGERIFVERIDVEGNATTLDRVVRRQFRVVEGDPFNPRQIRDAAERIRALGFFSQADVEAREGTSPDQVIVDVDVTEQPTGSFGFGATYSVDTGAGLSITFSERNFLGRGQALSFEFSTGDSTGTYSFNFLEPSLLGRDLGLRFRGSYSESQSATNQFYDIRRGRFSPSLEFPVSEFSRLSLNYTIYGDRMFNVSGDSSQLLVREAATGDVYTSSVGYSYSYRTLNTGLNPDAGVLLRFGQDFAGVGGDQEYIKTSAFAVAERKAFNDEVTLRAIFEGGALTMLNGGTSRATDRYYLNGVMRGFDVFGVGPRDVSTVNSDAVGGNYFAVAKFEAEFPLGLPEEYGVRGGLFLDVGSVWGLDDTAGGPRGGAAAAIDDEFKLRSAIGFSIFWTTPIGPLRFNFSHALQKETFDVERNFDLTISTRF